MGCQAARLHLFPSRARVSAAACWILNHALLAAAWTVPLDATTRVGCVRACHSSNDTTCGTQLYVICSQQVRLIIVQVIVQVLNNYVAR
jgi:hypothetical protein